MFFKIKKLLTLKNSKGINLPNIFLEKFLLNELLIMFINIKSISICPVKLNNVECYYLIYHTMDIYIIFLDNSHLHKNYPKILHHF